MSKIFLLFILFAACFAQASLAVSEETSSLIVRVRDYHSMLQSVAARDPLQLYSDEMAADPEACGIVRTETAEGYSYTIIPGMEDQPIQELSQEQQDYYFRWVEQDSPQGEEEHISPLMMYGEHEKGDSEEAKKKLALKQQQQERNRQATDEKKSVFSASEQRSQNPASIKEGSGSHQPPHEIGINAPLDDISEITGNYTTLESKQRSPSFSLKGGASSALLYQAKYKLREAREEFSNTRQYFDFSQSQWEASRDLEIAFKNHFEFQQRLVVSLNNWQHATTSLQQAQAAAREAWIRQDPSWINWNQIVMIAGREVHRTFHEHQALLFPAQGACETYCFAQNIGAQQGLIPGVDYTSFLNEAQLRVNRAAAQLGKCEAVVRRIKSEKTSAAKQKETGVLPKKMTTPVQKEQASQTTGRISEGKAGELEKEIQDESLVVPQQAESKSKSSAADSDQTSYQDQGTQISKEDLAAWNREEFLKQQDYWKKTFHQVVMQVQQAKKAVAADFSKPLLHEVSQEFISNDAQTFLGEEHHAVAERHAAEARRIAEEQKAEKELLLEKKKKIFSDLFFSEGETTEREKWELQQASTASIRALKEAERTKMKQFYAEHVNLLHPEEEGKKETKQQPEIKNSADNAASIIQRAQDAVAQSYRRSYEWCSDTRQYIQDQWQVHRTARQKTDNYFIAQGRRLADVAVKEYAWKNAEMSEQLYDELVEKRREEQAAAKALLGERDSSKELGYFEQMPYLLEGPVFRRFVTNFFARKIHDPNCESDERALDYFKEIGKPDPLIFEFWKKSAEIEKKLEKERSEKAKYFMQQFSDNEERFRLEQQWDLEWRERLKQEREEKKNEKLERAGLAEEERRQKIVQAVFASRADQEAMTRRAQLDQEAERQKIEMALLDQEAQEKAQKQSTKKKTRKKK